MAVVSGASSNSIGQPGQGNVISGNGHSGVWIDGFDNAGRTSSNTVAGNLIGTDDAGIAAIPNALDGVVVDNQAVSNQIGTTDAGGGNVISGNSQWGVYISDAGTNGNVVANNFIGTNVAGTYPVPNANNGVDIVSGAQNNTDRRDDGRRPQPHLGQPPRGRPDRLRRHGEQRGRGQLHRHRRHRHRPS